MRLTPYGDKHRRRRLEALAEKSSEGNMTDSDYQHFLQDWNEHLWELRYAPMPCRDALYSMLARVSQQQKPLEAHA